MSAKQTIHMKIKTYFLWKIIIEKFKISSALVMIGALRVNKPLHYDWLLIMSVACLLVQDYLFGIC